MTTTTPVFGNKTSLTITLNSLANSATAGRQSNYINTLTGSNGVCDVQFSASIVIGNTATSTAVNFYLSGGLDGATLEQDSAVIGTADAAYTIDSPTNLHLVRVMNASTSGDTYTCMFSAAQAFGGTPPPAIVVVVVNNSTHALGSSGNSINYRTVNYQTS